MTLLDRLSVLAPDAQPRSLEIALDLFAARSPHALIATCSLARDEVLACYQSRRPLDALSRLLDDLGIARADEARP